MLSGRLYLPQDLQLRRDRMRTQKLLRRFKKLLPSQKSKRYTLIKKLFSRTGASCSVYPPFHCDYGYNIRVGNNFFANVNCVILDVGIVNIGNNAMLGPGVMSLVASHPENVSLRNRGYGLGLPITIEDGVWVGAHAIINPEVHIGCNSIIGAGSVVTHSIPANVIAAGNPCKIIRTISGSMPTSEEVH